MAKDNFSAFLGAGTEFQGRLNFKGTVRIDCRFIGDVVSDGKLILGKDASLEGTISVADLVVHGNFTGAAVVTKRTILHQGANVTGNLTTRSLIMEDGACLQGELYMGKEIENLKPVNEAPQAIESQSVANPKNKIPVMDASLEQ